MNIFRHDFITKKLISPSVKRILGKDNLSKSDIEEILRLIKQNCHRITQLGLSYGMIKRPDKCQVCGVRYAAHGHHKNYLRPLDITWLCEFHHRFIHSKSLAENLDIIRELVPTEKIRLIEKLMLPPTQRTFSVIEEKISRKKPKTHEDYRKEYYSKPPQPINIPKPKEPITFKPLTEEQKKVLSATVCDGEIVYINLEG